MGGTLVRVIAARFREAGAVSRAVSRLRSVLDVGPDDVGTAPLGGVDQPQDAKYLLAGRFRESRLDEIRSIIEADGGEIVADLDELRTRPRVSGRAPVPEPLARRPNVEWLRTS
jgi:hypothetical protein